jgi:predicted transposase YdaD
MGQRKQKLTIEQVIENTGLGAKWEARGKAEGKAENKAEIARKMKNMGDSVERIHIITGLSPEAVKRL